MSKLFCWSVCGVVWLCLWEDCCWAWIQGVPPLAPHGLSLFGLPALALCDAGHQIFLMHIFLTYWSLSKSCYWAIQSFQWVTGFGLSSQGHWHRDCGMAAGRKIFGWQCLLWSHPGNHQSLFRGKVQTINLVPPLLGYFLEESENVSGKCCFWVCYVAKILDGGVIIETKQLLLTGLTVLIAFVHLWELSKTSRVFVWKLYIVACSTRRKGKMATMPEVLLKYKKMKQAI